MGRISIKAVVEAAWGNDWPPAVGRTVRIWLPKAHRGDLCEIMANADKARRGFNRMPADQVVVLLVDDELVERPKIMRRSDIMPRRMTLEKLNKLV